MIGLRTPPRFRPSPALKNARSAIDRLAKSIASPSSPLTSTTSRHLSSDEGYEMRSPKRKKTQSGQHTVFSPDSQCEVIQKEKQKGNSSGREQTSGAFPMSEACEFMYKFCAIAFSFYYKGFACMNQNYVQNELKNCTELHE